MGLDWNPGNKPKPGFEDEWREVILAVASDKLPQSQRPPLLTALWRELRGSFKIGARRSSSVKQESLIRRFNEISIPAFETLNAPRVGYDDAADAWARKTHAERKIAKPLDDWLREIRGYYVVSLVQCDGVPLYTNGPAGYVEYFSFRADFLKSCRPVIGNELLEEAYTLKFPIEFLAYGDQLIACADRFAREKRLTIPIAVPDATDSPAGMLHIATAAGRWCRFWAEHGHFLEPYF